MILTRIEVPILRNALRLNLIVLAVLFSQGSLGLLSTGMNRLGAVTAFLLYLCSWKPWSMSRIPGRTILGAAAMGTGGVFLAKVAGAASLTGLVLLLLAWELVLRASGRTVRLNAVLVVTLAVYQVYHLTHLTCPALWRLEESWCHFYSGLAGHLAREPYVHGATTQAWPALVFYLIFFITYAWWSRPRRLGLLLTAGAALVVTNGLYQAALTPVAVAIQRYRPGWETFLFNSQSLYVVMALIPCWLLLRSGREREPRRLGMGRRRWWLAVTVAAAGLLAGLLLSWPSKVSPRPGKILFLDRGYLNWRVPEFGLYGDKSGGMFGLLPRYLQALGYETETTRDITPEVFRDVACLVSVNLMEYLDEEEKEALWGFVREGGSFLVLGDHTGVMGIRGPYNDLLKPAEIEFLFDSATFMGRGWDWSLEPRPHFINRGLTRHDETQIWVGASLGVRSPARPVVVARYGFSDLGDHANIERAYLGDRRYNPGEILGDIILIAESRVGKGRVLVFGDTSTFQNLALFGGHAYVARTVQWLTGAQEGMPFAARAALAALLLAAGIAAAWLGAPSLGLVALGAAGLGLGWAGGSWTPAPPTPVPETRTAVVDASHTPRFDRLSWYDSSIAGLVFNLMRNDYIPLLMNRFDPRLYGESELILFLAPTKPLSAEEITWLTGYARGGGHLLLTVGFEEREGSQALLEAFGGRVAGIPLTGGHAAVWEHRVRLHEAWPIVSARGEGRVVAEFMQQPVIVYFPLGEGGLVAVGDSYFLQNRNLEGREEWQEGNILFLRDLFTRMREGRL